jgi:hypothetical protein
MSCPDLSTTNNSVTSCSTLSHSSTSPRRAISLPRTVIETLGKALSISLRFLSAGPTSATIGMAVGTVIRVRSMCGLKSNQVAR